MLAKLGSWDWCCQRNKTKHTITLITIVRVNLPACLVIKPPFQVANLPLQPVFDEMSLSCIAFNKISPGLPICASGASTATMVLCLLLLDRHRLAHLVHFTCLSWPFVFGAHCLPVLLAIIEHLSISLGPVGLQPTWYTAQEGVP